MDTITNSTNDVTSFIRFSVGALTINIFTIVLNITILVLITVFKLDRESYRFLFIRELSLTTIFNAFLIVLRDMAILTGYNIFANNAMCKFLMIATIGGMQVDLLTLLAIVADQYILIAYPFRYHDLLTKTRVAVIACLPLIIALANSVLMVTIWDDTYLCTFYQNLPQWYLCVLTFEAIGMAFVGTVTLQVLTIRIARRHMVQLQRTGQGHVSAETVRRHWRGVVTTLLICVMIFFSWFLGIVALLWAAIAKIKDLYSSKYFNDIVNGSSYMCLLRGIWVPLIHAIRMPEVRPVIMRIRNFFPAQRGNAVSAMCTPDT